MNSASAISRAIVHLYSRFGNENYSGENVSQLEHMLQAALLAEEQGYDEEIILAAFLHDIGHICESASIDNQMDGNGTIDHEQVGAAYLASKGFSRTITTLVQSHVQAKRWLTLREPGYYDRLSEASKETLKFQGGIMREEDAVEFEKEPLFHTMVQLRKWDEQAKVEGSELPDLSKYQEMMYRHLTNEQQAAYR